MKALHGLAGAGIVVGGLGAGGVLATGEVYPKPLDQAYAELASMPVPGMARQAAGGTNVVVRRFASSIEWHFQSDDEDVYVFTAKLSAADAFHTRVKVDFDVGDGLDDQSRRLIGSEYMRNTARLALTEQVAAELEDRSFDQMRFGRRLATQAKSHPEELQAFGNSIRQMMIDNAEVIRTQSADYRLPSDLEQEIATRRTMDEATRPMTQLPAN